MGARARLAQGDRGVWGRVWPVTVVALEATGLRE
jgi:hypothetical protein